MEWINGETQESKQFRMESWSPWFAWYPVKVGTIIINGKTRWIKVWLQYVLRKGRCKVYTGRFGIPRFYYEFTYTKIKKLGVLE